ncbi:hypothetical protein CP8484711_1561B, partial [Chlamydia psittaci 84-8471/1]
NDKTRFNTP